jgi:predicted Zn-dependent protease
MSGCLDREYFESLVAKVLGRRRAGEHFFINLSAEQSQFVRLNGAKIRQIGTVEDADLHITLVLESPDKALRTASASTTLCGLSYVDQERLTTMLETLRFEAPDLPVDPYAQLPKDRGSSEFVQAGDIPSMTDSPEAILGSVGDLDIAGIFAGGTVVRAMANTAGQRHWFSTRNFTLDYSLYTAAQRALKGTFAGTHWDPARYATEMTSSRQKLQLLDQPARRLERGTYRAYLEPAAYAELLQMLSWGAISEASIRQGDSPLRLMRETPGQELRRLSPLFALSEDFTSGMVPRFNSEGELAPEKLALIEGGVLKNSLVSSRTALEYKVPSNGAEDHEALRSPALAAGTLPTADALSRLGTGISLSNLHYLNWSDEPGGRVTGMTRYACFWVENGEIVAPIENMRFDDSIFSVFGSALEALTREITFLPDVQTYGRRSLGGTSCPGALLSGMEFTL